MAYYSFSVKAPHPVSITRPFVILDTGTNTFPAEVDDLEKFIERLHDEGISVQKVVRLDEYEENKPSDILLPGESMESLKGLLK